MSKSKHTPGPWKAWQPRADESVPVRTDGLGITIAYVHQGAITDAQANATLISAAPDMLEALPELSYVINWLENGCDVSEAVKELRIYKARIDAATAKAKGQ